MLDKLTFPLNVYARLLELDGQPVDYLHFGLFEKATDSVYMAQKRSTALLLKHMPDPPASVLEIGIGLGTTQKVLLDRGYDARGLTPDRHQVDIAKQRIGEKARLLCSSFEEWNDDRRYDVILSQESSQYVPLPELLPKVSRLLRNMGRFIVIDEFSIERKSQERVTLHQVDAFKNLAEISGLALSYEEDLSAKAKNTMKYLQATLDRYWPTILDLVEGDMDSLRLLRHSILDYIHKYDSGEYGYRLMVFEKSREQPWEISSLDLESRESFQQLFQSCFNKSMTLDHWLWKYEASDAHAMGILEEGKLIAHYAGLGRDIYYFGRPEKALQIVDTMVLPEKRGLFTKRGAFYKLARTFLQSEVGYGNPYLLGYGFPNRRVMDLASRLGLYGSVGALTTLRWRCSKTAPHALYSIRTVSIDDRSPVDELWNRMRYRLSDEIIGVRDWSYIERRYLRHPDISYSVMKVNNRISGGLVALFVIKIQDQTCHLMDVVCDPTDIKMMLKLVLRFAFNSRCTILEVLIGRHMKRYFGSGFTEEFDPGIGIPHCICTAGPKMETITDSWWIMAGDSDFM